MRKAIAITAMSVLGILGLLFVGVSAAAASLSVTPWTYSHGANSGEGVFGTPPVTSKCTAAGLTLIKTGATSDDSAAGATIGGANGGALTELGFDVASGGVFQDGPRFNVVTEENDGDKADSKTHFYGLSSATAVAGAAAGYQRYRMDLSKDGANNGGTGGKTVTSINVVFDNQGTTTLKNFDVNGTLANCVVAVVATPTPSTSATVRPSASASPVVTVIAQTGGGVPFFPLGLLAVGLLLITSGAFVIFVRRM